MMLAAELHGLIQARMATATTLIGYSYPLGYCTWTEDEVLAALECLCDRQTTMWTKTQAFEDQFAAYVGARYAVMVNSGSSADLVVMLAAVEQGLLKTGDEILVPAVTWPTQVWAAVQAGLAVRLVDVETSTLNTAVGILESAVTDRTKAVSLVHLMGNPCDLDAIKALCDKRGLLLFEDCCEALGSTYADRKVGTFGLAGTFSFFASHHISTMEGGMIVTDDAEFADACRLIRAHGWARDLRSRKNDPAVLNRYGVKEDSRYLFLGKGFNFRPTEVSAEIGRIQLGKLDRMNGCREENAKAVELYFRCTNGHFVEGLLALWKSKPAWFALPFVLRENLPYSREKVCGHLNGHGIDTRPIVGGNLARHPAFWKHRSMAIGPLPGANAIHDRGFYIGLPPVEWSMHGVIGALNSADSVLRCA